MKQFILIALTLVLFGCDEPKEVYETEIKTYVISDKQQHSSGSAHWYIIYIQTPTSNEKIEVNYLTFSNYKIGDTIKVLIKYWEKPKTK